MRSENTSPEQGSADALQISSSSGQQISAMSGVPVDRVPIGDDSESSPRHRRALSAGNRRGPSPYPITPGNTSRRHRASSPSTKAKAQALALIPPPAYACEISNPRPAGVPVSFAPGDGHATPDVHLHQHNQQVRQEVHLHGVDSATHSQALAAAHLAQAQAQSFVQSATTEAQNYVHNAQQEAMSRAAEYASKLRDEAENQVNLVAEEARRHLDQANVTIATLQSRNRELELQPYSPKCRASSHSNNPRTTHHASTPRRCRKPQV